MSENNATEAPAPMVDAATDNPAAQIEAFPEIPAPPGDKNADEPAGGAGFVMPILDAQIEDEPEKKKPGRPKGAKNKRKPKVAARAEPGPMFDGGPPEPTPEVLEAAPSTDAGAGQGKSKRKALSPKKLAEKTQKVMDRGFMFVVNARYKGVILDIPNPSNPTEIVSVPPAALAQTTDDEAAELIAELTDVFEDIAITVSPWQSLALTMATIYGQKLVAIEMLARAKYKSGGA